MGISTNSLLSYVSLVGCVGAAIYYVLNRKESIILRGSPMGLGFLQKKLLTTQEDKKLGLKFSFNPLLCTLHREVRIFPVAFYELKLVNEPDPTILLTVEEFDHEITLAEHKTYTYNAFAMHLSQAQIEKEVSGTKFGTRPGVELEYSYVSSSGLQCKSWCAIAVRENRAYSIHCQYPAANPGHSVSIFRQIASSIEIFDHSVPDSHLFFTEPRFGLGVQIPPAYHVEYTSSEKKTAIVRFQEDLRKDVGGVASFMELERISALQPEAIDHRTLEVAVTTVRGMIENSIPADQRLEWQTGTVLDDVALSYLKPSVVGAGAFEYAFVCTLSAIPGKFFFHDITASSPDGGAATRFVTFVVLTVYGVFRLTAQSTIEKFPSLFTDARECIQALTLRNQYGQECSLLYKNPKFRFQIRIPTHFNVQETMVADPIVMFLPGGSPNETDAPMFTIDVSSQVLSEADSFESCVGAYHDFLHGNERVSEVKRQQVPVDMYSATEFSFREALEEGTASIVVVLMIHENRQYIIQLTTEQTHLESSHEQFRDIIQTIRFTS
ncbi:FAD linked oxidase protein [Perkinsela sp. CCAP 1560/4]|nr:FAD linked oxidase protein [Perkinsela sp. CCAP 1560/4]|eukprot:KNH06364.1 FAD linked oxidase protein [Perkinsela sp. CCAP 1560/4]